MAICRNCGSEVTPNALYCPSCGAKLNEAENFQQAQNFQQPNQNFQQGQGFQQPAQNFQQAPGFQQPVQNFTPEYQYAQPETGTENEYTKEDIEQNKILSLFSYLGILFIIPLLAAKDSKYARFHANQGIILFLADIILGVCAAVPIIGWIACIAGYIFSVVCTVIGIINAVSGKAKELPLIGKFKILN